MPAPTHPLGRRLAAEALGTAMLVATVVGSGIMAERLADGNLAIALLGNTIPTGAILIVLITVLGPVSGAHFNPAVSMVLAARREFAVAELGPYVVAQCIGAVLGTVLAHLMFELAPIAIGDHSRTGGAQWLSEAVATFSLVLVILGGVRHAPQAVPWLVGLVITAAYWFTSSTSFANPAVTLGRGFTTTFAGIALGDVPGFIAAQLVGAAIAALAAMVLFPRRDPIGRAGP
ncbi:MAG: aquaporin family protein [Bauldia sp.]|nr:aquaporin family protein [Bauldia sp.]